MVQTSKIFLKPITNTGSRPYSKVTPAQDLIVRFYLLKKEHTWLYMAFNLELQLYYKSPHPPSRKSVMWRCVHSLSTAESPWFPSSDGEIEGVQKSVCLHLGQGELYKFHFPPLETGHKFQSMHAKHLKMRHFCQNRHSNLYMLQNTLATYLSAHHYIKIL